MMRKFLGATETSTVESMRILRIPLTVGIGLRDLDSKPN